MALSTSDFDYYTTQFRDVDARLQRSIACGWDNDSAYANIKHELREDITNFRAQVKTRAEEKGTPDDYAPLIAWCDRMEAQRREAMHAFEDRRRTMR